MANIKFQASYGILLRLLDIDGERDIDGLLLPIGGGITSSIKIIEEAEKRGEQEDGWLIDDECDSIEELLGLAFVAAQTSITRVISHCKMIHECHERRTKSRLLLGSSGAKDEILGMATPKIGGTNYTAIEAVNGFANYFKHHDEWPFDWNQLQKNNEKRTAAVIQAFGARPGSTGNIRTGYASVFGENIALNDVTRLGDVVRDWARALKSGYEQELEAAGFWSQGASSARRSVAQQ